MTPEQLADVILVGVGVAIQLAIMYVPKFNEWYDGLENKGLVALGFDVVFGLAYFGLGCTALADMLNIFITCDLVGAFTLLQAIFLIATSQQLAYLVTRKGAKG